MTRQARKTSFLIEEARLSFFSRHHQPYMQEARDAGRISWRHTMKRRRASISHLFQQAACRDTTAGCRWRHNYAAYR